MKPRIYKRNGLWYCRAITIRGFVVGVGYSPAHAYAQCRTLA